MSDRWKEKKKSDDEERNFSKKNGKEYMPNLRPIHCDKPSMLIKSGKAKYEVSKSLFGKQKCYGQIKLNFEPPEKKPKKQHLQKKVISEEQKDKWVRDWYILYGKDPRKEYEPEEEEYKRAVRVLTPIDIANGVIKLKDPPKKK